MNIKAITMSALLALGTITMGTAASAASIMKNGFYSGGVDALAAGSSAFFEFTATEDLRVLDFVSFTGNGAAANGDLLKAMYGYSGTPVTDTMLAFTAAQITINGATATASASLPGFVMNEGDVFRVNFAYGAGVNTVDMDYSFVTAAVPVPAAGFLLLGGLGGLAALRRRKQKATA